MARPGKREVIERLDPQRRARLAAAHGLAGAGVELIAALERASIELEALLAACSKDQLRSLCQARGRARSGTRAQLIARLLAEAPAAASVTLAVPPGAARLAYHGRGEAPEPGPATTRVIECVDGEEAGPLPPDRSRLILARDNLVALQALVDERDASGRPRWRGAIDLVYIDPPFMAGADFHAAGRGRSRPGPLAYRDTWPGGVASYLAMLTPRLALLRELLCETGTIYVHLDWHAVHYVKVLMDELFGADCFQNEIVWHYYNKLQGNVRRFSSNHDVILAYRKARRAYFAPVTEPRARPVRQLVRRWDRAAGKLVNDLDAEGRARYQLSRERRVDDVWTIPMLQPADRRENLGFPTQKRRAVVERIIAASCPEGGVVLDCFLGSGTAAVAAERLGRRFIGIDHGPLSIALARRRLLARRDPERPSLPPLTVEVIGVDAGDLLEDARALPPARLEAALLALLDATPTGDPTLQGRRDDARVHLGPLDAPVSPATARALIEAVAAAEGRALTIVSREDDGALAAACEELGAITGVTTTVRTLSARALAEARDPGPTRPDRDALLPVRLAVTLAVTITGLEVQVDLRAGAPGGPAIRGWAIDWSYGRRRDDAGAPVFAPHTWRVRSRSDAALPLRAIHRYRAAGRATIVARVCDPRGATGEARRVVELAGLRADALAPNGATPDEPDLPPGEGPA
ncbi:MAG: hypothetical protein KC636_23785 [Myxococcales bacterium]|nr:hypothetical protein [Myxococcales bacterium]